METWIVSCVHRWAVSAFNVTLAALLMPAVLFLIGCESFNRRLPPMQVDTSIREDGKLDFLRSDGSTIASIIIEIADTPESREKGLMGRGSPDFSSGMLFVFQEVEPQNFWMRNTPEPLDLIFVGKNSCVLNVSRRAKPMSDQTYHSKSAVKYVVEVRAGFADRYGIDEGTRIRWHRRE